MEGSSEDEVQSVAEKVRMKTREACEAKQLPLASDSAALPVTNPQDQVVASLASQLKVTNDEVATLRAELKEVIAKAAEMIGDAAVSSQGASTDVSRELAGTNA